ncbi:MAG: hypothetical protein FWH22_10070, partial [Fibromonadales bacterium]|nr:hypothetical protein [Fibromonadales bacterium]
MNKAKFVLFAASIMLAMAFIFSCSSDSGGGGGGVSSGALTITNPPAGQVSVSVLDYSKEIRSHDQTMEVMLSAQLAVNALVSASEPVPLLDLTGKTFNENGTFAVVIVSGMQSRYFDQVVFSKGGAIINWNQNYYDPIEGYVSGGGNSSSGGKGNPSSGSQSCNVPGLVLSAGEAWVYNDMGFGEGMIFQSNCQVLFVSDYPSGNWTIDETSAYSVDGNQITIDKVTVTYVIAGNNLMLIWPDSEVETFTKTSGINVSGGNSSSSGGASSSSADTRCKSEQGSPLFCEWSNGCYALDPILADNPGQSCSYYIDECMEYGYLYADVLVSELATCVGGTNLGGKGPVSATRCKDNQGRELFCEWDNGCYAIDP